MRSAHRRPPPWGVAVSQLTFVPAPRFADAARFPARLLSRPSLLPIPRFVPARSPKSSPPSFPVKVRSSTPDEIPPRFRAPTSLSLLSIAQLPSAAPTFPPSPPIRIFPAIPQG